MSDQPKLRKSVRNLHDSELEAFRYAFGEVMKICDERGFNVIAGFHGTPSYYCAHGTAGGRFFLPWHRAYLLWLEAHIQDHDEEVMLPWWNWMAKQFHPEGMPKAYTDNMAVVKGKKVPNVLKEFFSRHLLAAGENKGFTWREPNDPKLRPFPPDPFLNTEELLAISNFAEFSDTLENVHGAIHGWVGGSMSKIDHAAFDPIFWAHHCMVDRLWWMWQNRHGNATMPAEMLDKSLCPFNKSVRAVLDIHALGYEYSGAAGIFPPAGDLNNA